jgi:hypothetical protein
VPGFLVWNLAVTFLADLDVLLVGLLALLLEVMKHVDRITAVSDVEDPKSAIVLADLDLQSLPELLIECISEGDIYPDRGG